MIWTQIIFYFFAVLAVVSAVMVIASRNPVQGVLFLVLTFVAMAGIWMMMQAEFLSLVLILVYVGAVMTLFLFVVMMFNLGRLPKMEAFKRYFPLALIIGGLIVAVVVIAIQPKHFGLVMQQATQHGADYSNIKAIGSVLYTNYVYAFEIAAVILLASIIAAIALAFRGVQPGTKSQNVSKQVNTKREDAVRMVRD
tara:strand:- start:39791 stop:40378 length:588 start_codon:yes stop_codon:yes gene_type:complete